MTHTAALDQNATQSAAQIPIIDIDSHLMEPGNVWIERLGKKWGKAVPHPEIWDKTGQEHWRIGRHRVFQVSRYAHGGWDGYWPSFPPTLDQAIPAAKDPVARLAYMDEQGIQAQIMYPNVLAFAAFAFLELDPELALDCVRAYNDFQLEYCSVNLDRLVPLAFTPYWDLDAAITEIKRCLKKGYKAINFAWNFEKAGLPPIRSEHWYPIFDLAQANEVSINFHIGTGRSTAEEETRKINRTDMMELVRGSTLGFMANAACIAELVTSDICHKFPRVNFVSVESGFGFIPFLLEALDWQFLNVGGQHQRKELLLPSEYFERQVFASFWFERNVGRLIDMYPDNVMFETDFPHPSGLTVGSGSVSLSPRDTVQFRLNDIPEPTLRKVLYQTASRIYHIDVPGAPAR